MIASGWLYKLCISILLFDIMLQPYSCMFSSPISNINQNQVIHNFIHKIVCSEIGKTLTSTPISVFIDRVDRLNDLRGMTVARKQPLSN